MPLFLLKQVRHFLSLVRSVPSRRRRFILISPQVPCHSAPRLPVPGPVFSALWSQESVPEPGTRQAQLCPAWSTGAPDALRPSSPSGSHHCAALSGLRGSLLRGDASEMRVCVDDDFCSALLFPLECERAETVFLWPLMACRAGDSEAHRGGLVCLSGGCGCRVLHFSLE